MTAHPAGCAANVAEQIAVVRNGGPISGGPKRALVIGASTGYGLASRIAAAFGSGADTVGVSYERPATEKRTASAGWYNTAAFEREAAAAGVRAFSINGDAYSDEIKDQTIAILRDLGPVDLVVYSLAAPRRLHPKTGETHSSVLKTIGKPFTEKSVDPATGAVEERTVEPATPEEVDGTVSVMGGEDWRFWLERLDAESLLSEQAVSLAYSYLGPEFTHPIYRDGTIGRAKADLEKISRDLDASLGSKRRTLVSINKALVTQASAAIPIVPLYIALLYRIMAEAGLHEGCIEQIDRLFRDRLYAGGPIPTDPDGRIRLDDWEMRDDIQAKVSDLWPQVTNDNVGDLTDIDGYRREFLKLFGFERDDIDYRSEIDPDVRIASITEAS